jgi:hypothetical protein
VSCRRGVIGGLDEHDSDGVRISIHISADPHGSAADSWSTWTPGSSGLPDMAAGRRRQAPVRAF